MATKQDEIYAQGVANPTFDGLDWLGIVEGRECFRLTEWWRRRRLPDGGEGIGSKAPKCDRWIAGSG